MVNCAVKSCKSCNIRKDFDKNIRFFIFPKDPIISDLWMKACGKGTFNKKHARICSLHFTDEQWRLQDKLLNMPIKNRRLDPKAVPIIKLPENNSIELDINRTIRSGKRNIKNVYNEALEEYEIEYEQLKLQQVEVIEIQKKVEDDQNKTVGIQSEMQLEYARDVQIIELKRKMKLFEKQLKKKDEECDKMKVLKSSVENIFTKGQITKLMNPKKKITWSSKDISSAILLHSAGPRAYRYMYKKKFPLPGPSTLKVWASKNKINKTVT